jgi:hypothetical protein
MTRDHCCPACGFVLVADALMKFVIFSVRLQNIWWLMERFHHDCLRLRLAPKSSLDMMLMMDRTKKIPKAAHKNRLYVYTYDTLADLTTFVGAAKAAKCSDKLTPAPAVQACKPEHDKMSERIWFLSSARCPPSAKALKAVRNQPRARTHKTNAAAAPVAGTAGIRSRPAMGSMNNSRTEASIAEIPPENMNPRKAACTR